ncbi:MAG TPA: ABC transporter permease, partial [Sphingobacteriaceae bacterium]|nr:ABC transporter permease [Sphingobacteriaceae bacterium]
YTLGAAVTGILLSKELPISFILPVVMFAGAIAGALTGIIHTKLKINALLAGILVMTALYSVNLTLLGRSNIPFLNYQTLFSKTILFADPNLNTLWILLLFAALLVLLIGYILKTDFGIAMRATGNSETMIRALGVNTDRMKITGLAIANALTAASGFLMSQFQGFVDINMGIGIVIVGLGSVIIAETLINWLHITSVWLSLFLILSGAILFQLVLAFTLSIGIDANLLKLVTAVFVLLIVSLPRISFIRSYD